MVTVYPILNRDLLVAGVIFHDIEKMTEIRSNELGVSDGYSFEGKLLGHLVQGVKVIEELAKELGMSEEKSIMLQHMSISHHYEPEMCIRDRIMHKPQSIEEEAMEIDT